MKIRGVLPLKHAFGPALFHQTDMREGRYAKPHNDTLGRNVREQRGYQQDQKR